MYKIKVNDLAEISMERNNDNLLFDGTTVQPDIKQLSAYTYHVINDLKSYNVEVVSFDAAEKTASIKVNGNTYELSAQDQFDLLLEQMGLSNLNASKVTDLKAPMPGLVLKVFVNAGDEVRKGDNLFVLEAMKMENIIKSAGDATVKAIKIVPGDKVEKGQVLIQFA